MRIDSSAPGRPRLQSEFEYISWEACHHLGIHESTQGIDFDHWIPLPICQKNWNKVNTPAADTDDSPGPTQETYLEGSVFDRVATDLDVHNITTGIKPSPTVRKALRQLCMDAYLHDLHGPVVREGQGPEVALDPADELIGFMSDVVTQIEGLRENAPPRSHYDYFRENETPGDDSYELELELEPKSALCHSSEKAINAFFHLFHMLVCLAAEDRSIVDKANSKIEDFVGGKRSKYALTQPWQL